jgi:hypothetical protein
MKKLLVVFAVLYMIGLSHAAFVADYQGRTAGDKLNATQVGANGVNDYHIMVSGYKANPVAVLIKSGDGSTGTWAWPFNGLNWLVLVNGNRIWFDYYPGAEQTAFTVEFTYEDGSKETAVTTIPPLNGNKIPPEAQLVDAKGRAWARGPEAVAGQQYTHVINDYIMCNGIVYGFNVLDKKWWKMDDEFTDVGSANPCP